MSTEHFEVDFTLDPISEVLEDNVRPEYPLDFYCKKPYTVLSYDFYNNKIIDIPIDEDQDILENKIYTLYEEYENENFNNAVNRFRHNFQCKVLAAMLRIYRHRKVPIFCEKFQQAILSVCGKMMITRCLTKNSDNTNTYSWTARVKVGLLVFKGQKEY